MVRLLIPSNIHCLIVVDYFGQQHNVMVVGLLLRAGHHGDLGKSACQKKVVTMNPAEHSIVRSVRPSLLHMP